MTQGLQYWQKKIQEKRKKTEFRDFLMEIGSGFPFLLYKNEGIISRYPKTKRKNRIISSKEFIENMPSNDIYGIDYDFSKDFFHNYSQLLKKIDFPNLWHFTDNENCDFSDTIGDAKNCYLTICAGVDIENIFYSIYVISGCRNIYNCVSITNNSHNIYLCSGISKSYNIFYSKYIFNSSNIWFSTNLIGCKECILCDNLKNKSYYIKNIEYSREEYFKKKEEIIKNKKGFFKYYKELNSKSINIGGNDIKGSYIINSENIENGYFVNQVKNGKNLLLVGNGDIIKNCYDNISSATRAEDSYGNMGCSPGEKMFLCFNSGYANNIYYSTYINNCSYCLGCIGLKNKSYCIFNKQYSKEDWYKKVDEIFSQMEKDGTLGDFFPGELNPFYFNDTMAGLLGDFTKEEVEAKGYMWRDEKIKVDIPEGSEVVSTKELHDFQGYDENGKWYINPEILKKVIVDENGDYYRIVEMEYDFLMKHELPLPEIHWMERMKLNLGINK